MSSVLPASSLSLKTPRASGDVSSGKILRKPLMAVAVFSDLIFSKASETSFMAGLALLKMQSLMFMALGLGVSAYH